MKRTRWMLAPILAASLLLSGCAGHGEWFLHYDDDDHGGEVVGKTLANVGLAALYIAGSIVFLTAWIIMESETRPAEVEYCDHCHRNPCRCGR